MQNETICQKISKKKWLVLGFVLVLVTGGIATGVSLHFTRTSRTSSVKITNTSTPTSSVSWGYNDVSDEHNVVTNITITLPFVTDTVTTTTSTTTTSTTTISRSTVSSVDCDNSKL